MPPKRLIPQLLKDLEPIVQATVQSFEKIKNQIECTKCTQKNTMVHINNTTTTPPKPVFECSSCKYKPIFQNFQKEIQYIISQPLNTETPNQINIPPIDLSFSTNGKRFVFGVDEFESSEKDTNQKNNKTTTTKKQLQPQPRPSTSNKRIRRKSDDATADNQQTATALGNLQQLVESLQARLSTLEKENADIKQQLQHSLNKNASLEQRLLLQQKDANLHALTMQQTTTTTTTTAEGQADDIEMSSNDIDFPTLKSTILPPAPPAPITTSAASKWAQAFPNIKQAPHRPPTQNQTKNNTKNKKNNNNKKINNKNNKTNNTTNPTSTFTNPPPRKRKEDITKKFNIAIRAFTAPNEHQQQGFSYVYYPAKNRISRKIQRKNLTILGVNNSRILDIHYPSRNVVALLVHNDYRNDLINTLKLAQVNPLEDYSPTAPSSLSDPIYKDLSNDEKQKIATEKQNQRLVRALPFIRTNISKAVARFFVNENLITNDQYNDFITSLKHTEAKSSPSKGSNKLPITPNKFKIQQTQQPQSLTSAMEVTL